MLLLLVLLVTVYRCDVMARDCSTCLSLRETANTGVRYDCQWCGDVCQFNGTCQVAPSAEVCPHPHIQHVILSLRIHGNKNYFKLESKEVKVTKIVSLALMTKTGFVHKVNIKQLR